MIYIIGLIVLFLIYRKITAPKVVHVTINEVHDMLKDKKTKRQFIDVRTTDEFRGRKIKGFKNIPLQSLGSQLGQLSKDQPVVLMCASGSRSMSAARVLSKAGYTQLINVRGGIR